MNDDRDPILDACLDEVLGGHAPPDLSERILKEWSRRSALAGGVADGESAGAVERVSETATGLNPAPILPPACASPHETLGPGSGAQPAITVGGKSRAGRAVRRNESAAWVGGGLAVAAGLLVVLAAGVALQRSTGKPTAASSPRTPSPRSSVPPSAPAATQLRTTAPRNDTPLPEKSTLPAASARPAMAVLPPGPAAPSVETEGARPGDSPALPQLATAPLPSPLDDTQIVQAINQAIREHWTTESIAAPQLIAEEEWRRRLFQVVLGREPTAAEAAEFRAASFDERAAVVKSLTSSDRYLEEFARHWSAVLGDVLLPADLVEGSSPVHRDGMLQYLRRSLLAGRGYDQMVVELLTATGSGRPGDPDYNGAANFLLARAGGKLEHATADTARLFLGRNVACQQCHDHPSASDRGQQEFWELNAFFRQLAAVSDQEATGLRLVDRDFLGDDRRDGGNAMVFYEQPDGVLKGAFPQFREQPSLPRSGLVDDVNRRQLLAMCVTQGSEFRQASVNRVWSSLLGSELAPSSSMVAGPHYELLTTLGDQFAAHRFDLRRAIGWVALSDPFAAPAAESTFALANNGSPRFDRFQGARPMAIASPREALAAAIEGWGKPSGNASTTARLDATSSKTLVPGKLMAEPADGSLFSSTHATQFDPLVQRIIAHPEMSVREKSEHLFQLLVHRAPRARELEMVDRLLELSKDSPQAGWQAVVQSLRD